MVSITADQQLQSFSPTTHQQPSGNQVSITLTNSQDWSLKKEYLKKNKAEVVGRLIILYLNSQMLGNFRAIRHDAVSNTPSCCLFPYKRGDLPTHPNAHTDVLKFSKSALKKRVACPRSQQSKHRKENVVTSCHKELVSFPNYHNTFACSKARPRLLESQQKRSQKQPLNQIYKIQQYKETPVSRPIEVSARSSPKELKARKTQPEVSLREVLLTSRYFGEGSQNMCNNSVKIWSLAQLQPKAATSLANSAVSELVVEESQILVDFFHSSPEERGQQLSLQSMARRVCDDTFENEE